MIRSTDKRKYEFIWDLMGDISIEHVQRDILLAHREQDMPIHGRLG